MGTTITSLKRVDLYKENEVDVIVAAQKARSAQSFPTTALNNGGENDYSIYVYAFTTENPIDTDNFTVEGLSDMNVIGKASFKEAFDYDNKYAPYAPSLSGSIRLTFIKKQ